MATDPKQFKGSFVIIARVEAHPGKGDELAQWSANLKARADSDTEPGTLSYQVNRIGDQFAIYEKYKDHEAFVAHREGNPLYQDFQRNTDTMVKVIDAAFWPCNSLPEPTLKF